MPKRRIIKGVGRASPSIQVSSSLTTPDPSPQAINDAWQAWVNLVNSDLPSVIAYLNQIQQASGGLT